MLDQVRRKKTAFRTLHGRKPSVIKMTADELKTLGRELASLSRISIEPDEDGFYYQFGSFVLGMKIEETNETGFIVTD